MNSANFAGCQQSYMIFTVDCISRNRTIRIHTALAEQVALQSGTTLPHTDAFWLVMALKKESSNKFLKLVIIYHLISL